MTNLLRVLEMLEKADVKALQCEVPVELLQGLNIQEDGTVDLEALLKICHRANRLDALKKSQEALDVSSSGINPDLMDLIFNPDIAADFSNDFKHSKKI
jgi:hypothetical protein